jgi:hypothetical protein
MDKSNKYTTEAISIKEVPSAAEHYLNKHFSGDVVLAVVKGEQNSKPVYIINVDHNGLVHHLKFDHEGNFVIEKIEETGEPPAEHFITIGGAG